MKKRMIISMNVLLWSVILYNLYTVKYWLWSLYKWCHGSWVVHDLFRVQSEARRVSPDQIWTARLLGWVTRITLSCSGHSHLITETREKTEIQKSSCSCIKLKLLFVVVSWVKKFPLTPPWTKFLFHNIDMKWEASGIPISHNNKQAAKPSHEVLSPNRNNPRPFHIDPPGATAHSPSKWQHCTVASGLMAFVQ